jgi:hypothetical protein
LIAGTEGEELLLDFSREIGAVVLVLGILTACLLALRRSQAAEERAPGMLRSVARLRLSEHLVLHVVDCGGERCLVSEQKSGCTMMPLKTAAARPVSEGIPACRS